MIKILGEVKIDTNMRIALKFIGIAFLGSVSSEMFFFILKFADLNILANLSNISYKTLDFFSRGCSFESNIWKGDLSKGRHLNALLSEILNEYIKWILRNRYALLVSVSHRCDRSVWYCQNTSKKSVCLAELEPFTFLLKSSEHKESTTLLFAFSCQEMSRKPEWGLEIHSSSGVTRRYKIKTISLNVWCKVQTSNLPAGSLNL